MFLKKIRLIVIFILIVVLIINININIEKFDNNNDSKIYLITQYYIPKDKEREIEINTCLQKNLNNNYIDKIILFGEDNYKFNNFENKNKINFFNIKNRLSFKIAFNFCNKINNNKKFKNDIIFILANSDINFDNSLEKLKNYRLENTFLALSRIENVDKQNNFVYHINKGKSQDTWIWKNNLNIENRNLTKFNHYNNDGILMGIHGCDNYIAYMMDDIGFKVENKCKLVNTFHNHKNDFREWNGKDKLNYNLEFKKLLKCEK